MAKYDEYTPENLARVTDESVIADAVATIKGGFRIHDKRHGSLMVAAAYATVAAVRAKVATKSGLAAEWGKNGSTITLYNRLGIVAADLDVTPGGVEFSTGNPLWTILAGKGGATISRVGMYIEGGKSKDFPYFEGQTPTVEGLVDLLTDYFKPNGDKVGTDDRKKNEARREWMLANPEADASEYAPAQGEAGDDGDDPESPEGTRTLVAKFKAALSDVTSLAEQLSSEQWTTVLDDVKRAHKALTEKDKFEAKQVKAAS